MCMLAVAPAMSVRADQIVMDKTNYPGAKIVGLQEGQLQFRSADGSLQTVWLHDVRLINVDRGGIFDDFNQAERFFAGGEHDRAIVRYRRTLRLSEDFWTDLIAARLTLACDAAEQLDTAVLNLIRVINGRFAGPPAAARLIPREIPAESGKRVMRAVEQLHAALAKDPDDPQRALLKLVRYEILQGTGDRRAIPAAPEIAAISIPPSARSQRVYAIQLRAFEEALADDVEPAELSSLDIAIRDCPDEILPSFLLLKGRTLLRTAATREELIRASWPSLRVAVHFRNDSRAAEGLHDAALALERLGRPDKARELLQECLGHKWLTPQTQSLAETARARLLAPGASPD
ncbi:MAG: hypothetical protein JSU86_10600 [Phycisphaerales bacterium]|nr:MAG: hypothetical protein JSU86_10600 [Phycisphaerales bacterium]